MCEIEIYKTNSGKEPFREWLKTLEWNIAARIDARLTRIRQNGNLGNCKYIGDGIYELKFDFGPGYRIYFWVCIAYKINSSSRRR